MLDKRGIKYANNFKGNIISIQSSHLSGNFYFKIKSTFSLFIGLIQSIFYIVKIIPRHCISFGSYASFTPLLISIFFKFIKKIDIHIHEQNSVMGRVNLFFLPYSKNIFTNFEHINNIKKELKSKSQTKIAIFLKKMIETNYFKIKNVDLKFDITLLKKDMEEKTAKVLSKSFNN